MVRQCSGTKLNGEACRAPAMGASDFCVSHDPKRVVDIDAWRAKGGQQRSNRARAKKALPAELMTMAEVHSFLGITLRGVLSGKLEPGIGTAVANIARAMRDVGAAAELESQIADMTRQIADISQRRPA